MPKRRSPQKHTVHTKHPRYTQRTYQRGQGSIMPQEDRLVVWDYQPMSTIIRGKTYHAKATAFSERLAKDYANEREGFHGEIAVVRKLFNRLLRRDEYTIYVRKAKFKELANKIRREHGNAFKFEGKWYQYSYRKKEWEEYTPSGQYEDSGYPI